MQREAVRHPCDEFDDRVRIVAAGDEVLEYAGDHMMCPLVLSARVLAEVDALEHERPEREHRLPDLVALTDVSGGVRAFDQVAHERVDALRAGLAQQLDLVVRQFALVEDSVPKRVVDVVVDLRDSVADADDLALERRRLDLARVRQDAVTYL